MKSIGVPWIDGHFVTAPKAIVALALCLGLPRISAGRRQHHKREESKDAVLGHPQGKRSGSLVHINTRQQHTAASLH